MAISDFLYPFFNWPLYASEGMLTPNILISQPWVSFACRLGITNYNQALKNLLSPMLSLCTSNYGCKVVKRKQSAAIPIQVTNM
ncbi:hypothetical protein P5673_032294 [Acropora cervicornis]|uniref:Uncharacterized protein n=1 Tax=Acropora cervicornis TaxID=6130 RepID=A0AAD9URW7_ACRCE|nr:hypothetical protein P5673_032294 [Acropora cervicornis]